MSKSSKKLISILLLFSLLLLVGCEDIIDSPVYYPQLNPDAYEQKDKEIFAPVEIPYVIENPIEIISISTSKSAEHHHSYFQIDGLVNQAVEDSINNDIKELYDQLIPYTTGEMIAPYRGIQSSLASDKKVMNSNLIINPYFNSNNVLSVVANLWVAYSTSTNEQVYFSMVETLNYDLNTGKTFLLEDIFVDNVDGLGIINDGIISELERRRLYTNIEYDYSLNLVAPFKGIGNKQKFYLSYDGINIVIDHNNPEFDVGFSDSTILIPFNSHKDQIAISQRYYDETNSIFSNEAVSKRFLPDSSLNINHEKDTYNKNGIRWDVSSHYPKGLSQDFIEIVEDIRVEYEEEIIIVSQEKPIMGVEQNIYVFRIGNFVNVNNQSFIYRKEDALWQESKYVYTDSGEQVRLEDIFVEGYDYTSLIKQTIDRTIMNYGLTQAVDSEDIFDDLMFNLNDSHISFIKKIEDDYREQINFEIPYSEIGYKNLKIFD